MVKEMMTRTPELGHLGAISLWEVQPPNVIGGDVNIQQLIGIFSLESGKELFKVIDRH
jgi:hypothetical protein